jgi:hypothetical protein
VNRLAGLAIAAALFATGCAVTVDSSDDPGAGVTDPAIESAAGGRGAADLGTALAQAMAQGEMAQHSYEAVVAQLGPIAPFDGMVRAEAADVAAVRAAAGAHGLTIGGEPVPGSPAPPDRASACLVAAEIEKSTVSMYDELLPQVRSYPDVTRLFTRLRAAAKDEHLPAFERCV